MSRRLPRPAPVPRCRCRACLVQSLLRARSRILRGKNVDQIVAAEIVDSVAWALMQQHLPAICPRSRQALQDACARAVPLAVAEGKAP